MPQGVLDTSRAGAAPVSAVGAWVEYLRDLGIHDFYRWATPAGAAAELGAEPLRVAAVVAEPAVVAAAPSHVIAELDASLEDVAVVSIESDVTAMASTSGLVPLDRIAPAPSVVIAPGDRAAALRAIQEEIGDCTRCPLAYGGRRKIVFGDGSPTARLMFVGEGPGADEDAQGLPFVGKAGQLLNNMISAMGLKREEVYIANIVKCRPPANRVPEPVEANTCSPFLLRQIDVVRPEVIVALGSTAATYLLGVKQSLAVLRGRWHKVRDAKVAVTYHPAFLLRDPRMKGEAWKDLQMVMAELGLKAPQKKS